MKDSTKIRRMFATIARRYDFLNHLLSLNMDRRWRRRAAAAVGVSPGDRLLDLCTGTADLALELAQATNGTLDSLVVGVDFCPEMVLVGEQKRRRQRQNRTVLVVGDALELPFSSATFDGATVAFGIRNVCDLSAGLAEIHRVLRPGGRLAVLEFTTPRHAWLRRLYHLYFHRVLPRVGRCLAPRGAVADAYAYLPESVQTFPTPDELQLVLQEVGFRSVRYELLTGGIVALHVAESSTPPPAGRRACSEGQVTR